MAQKPGAERLLLHTPLGGRQLPVFELGLAQLPIHTKKRHTKKRHAKNGKHDTTNDAKVVVVRAGHCGG